MPVKERIGLADAYSLTLGGVAIGPSTGGQVSVTGTHTVTVPFNAITSVVASLGAAAGLTGSIVEASWSGLTITLTVTEPSSTSNTTPVASTTPTLVNWIAVGS